MRFVLYARASTKDKQNPDHQLAELRMEAARRGWTVVREVIERESGRKDDRPEWQAAIDDVLCRRADGIAAVELSRFARSTRHLLEVATALRRAGCHLVATRQKIDTTDAMGRLVFTILAALAEFEADLTRERVTAGVRYAIEKRGGAWGKTRETLPAPARDMVAHLRLNGASWPAISVQLAAAGYTQPARVGGRSAHPARPWPVQTLKDVLARNGLAGARDGQTAA